MSNRRPPPAARVDAIRTLDDAIAVAHTLSRPTKMPWFSYNLPAATCRIGGKLAQQENTVCSKCYALKNRYLFSAVQNAMWLRFFAINHPLWVDAMVFQLRHYERRSRGITTKYFRWHDSGDIQSLGHLEKITKICEATPNIHHWLPTRELKLVKAFLDRHQAFPHNLVVRMSVHHIGKAPARRNHTLPVSTVGVDGFGTQCDAYSRDGKCGPCRACWTPADINYPLH